MTTNYHDEPCLTPGHTDCLVIGFNSDPRDIANFGIGWHRRKLRAHDVKIHRRKLLPRSSGITRFPNPNCIHCRQPIESHRVHLTNSCADCFWKRKRKRR